MKTTIAIAKVLLIIIGTFLISFYILKICFGLDIPSDIISLALITPAFIIFSVDAARALIFKNKEEKRQRELLQKAINSQLKEIEKYENRTDK